MTTNEQQRLKDFEDLYSRLKELNLEGGQKELMVDALKYLQDDMRYLDYDAYNFINKLANKESNNVKKEIQSNVRLYKRSNQKYIKHFLINCEK